MNDLEKYPKCVSSYNAIPSKVEKWFPLDTEKLFNYNLKNRYDELKLNGWLDKEITYTINEEGFRTEELKEPKDSLFFGCSNTFGIGLQEKNIWPSIVKEELKITGYNLGVPGGSNDTIFRLANYWIPIIKPKYVFALTPDEARKEYILKNKIIQMCSNLNPKSSEDEKVLRKFYEDQIVSDWESEINYQKNILAIERLCEKNNCKFVNISIYDFYNVPIKDLARDLQHKGENFQKFIANKFIEKFYG